MIVDRCNLYLIWGDLMSNLYDFKISLPPKDADNLMSNVKDLFNQYGLITKKAILELCGMPIEEEFKNYIWLDIKQVERTCIPEHGLIQYTFHDGIPERTMYPVTEPDQTIKADAGKPRLTLVPQQIIFDIAKVREYGLAKYGESESWRKVDIQRYRDAAYRHFMAYLKNPQGVDDESGLSHLSHLACNIAFLSGMENDISRKESKE